MELYKLKLTRLHNEIFRLLCIKVGVKLNQRDIARNLKVSPTAVAKSVKLLETKQLIKVEKSKTMNLTSIELNRDNHKAVELKRIENLKLIYDSNLIDSLEEKFPGCTIIIFGSYSKGEDTIKSDIDIAIIGSKSKTVDLGVFDKKLERKIFLQFYDSFKDLNKNLKSNILNGITLAGGVEL
ncbi:MAG: nucleotidyltransferase domain-containing protein [Nanoarchaeota archaeon]|nr:nucleotidyltransferase domain-containing protein [Nanoarchaeota archaeon]MBU1632493.1 nucleotidyltransferase domain-containing protein [Nanoarchaeota archaeon]MBU1876643.1 nucleotidyltransferase domain-containing protein [Nanoarchaeota archaeon]